MSASLFLDASGWFAAIAPRQRHHARAAAAYDDAGSTGWSLVTTSLVVAEMHALVLRSSDPSGGRQFLNGLLDSGSHGIVYADPELTEAAISRWIHGLADQSFTLCDAVSFEVMRRERVSRALTFDRHFTTAGFEMLP